MNFYFIVKFKRNSNMKSNIGLVAQPGRAADS